MTDIYKVKITGLSKDMEDFIFERDVHFSLHKKEFWSSFWESCADVLVNGRDLSEKQLNIIKLQYKKRTR